MTRPAHVYEIFVRAPIDRVWEAITDPDHTRRYFHRTAVDSAFTLGAPVRYVLADGSDAVEGTIEAIDPPHRLVMTWHVLYDAALAEEPPSRVEWTLRPADDDGAVTRVTLRHGGLGLSPKTWANVRLGWVVVLDGLKTLLETGEPLGPVDQEEDPPGDVDAGIHRDLAVRANGEAWRLIDALTARVGDDDTTPERLLEAAYASAHHWRHAADRSPATAARAAWLVSRAWVLAGNGGVALRYAEDCLTSCVDNDLTDFDLAYAHEARARAMALLGRNADARGALTAARAVPVADDEDRSILEADLRSGPWFGLEVEEPARDAGRA